MFAELAIRANARVVVATDAGKAGKRHAIQLSEQGANVGVSAEQGLPNDSLNDRHDVLKARTGRGLR